jgi:hypothetical protein
VGTQGLALGGDRLVCTCVQGVHLGKGEAVVFLEVHLTLVMPILGVHTELNQLEDEERK